MYPNLYYFFRDMFGVGEGWEFLQVFQSFGFMMALAFLTAHYIFVVELKRKEREGIVKAITRTTTAEQAKKQQRTELIVSVLLGFILGYKGLEIFLNSEEFFEDTQGFILSGRGHFLGGVIAAAIFGYLRYAADKKVNLPGPQGKKEVVHPYQVMGSITIAAALIGLLGAKIFHNLENWGDFTRDPLGELFAFSGLTFYGGLICGGAVVLYMGEKNGVPWKHMLDVGAPAMMLSYGIGRIGCHVAGDGDWGIVNTAPKPSWLSWAPDWLWRYDYPHNVLNDGEPIADCVGKYCMHLVPAVFPTPLYEAIVCTILFLGIWAIRKHIRIPGILFGIYLILNGLERFMIEKIRVNNKMDFLGMQLTQAEIISFSLILTGAVGIAILYFRHKKLNGSNTKPA